MVIDNSRLSVVMFSQQQTTVQVHPEKQTPLLLLLRRSQLALAEKADPEPDTFASLQLYRPMTSSDLSGCMHPQEYININLYQWT